ACLEAWNIAPVASVRQSIKWGWNVYQRGQRALKGPSDKGGDGVRRQLHEIDRIISGNPMLLVAWICEVGVVGKLQPDGKFIGTVGGRRWEGKPPGAINLIIRPADPK